MNKLSNRRLSLITGIVLLAVTFVAFYQALGYDFINLDDDVYVLNNRHVQTGLNSASLRWAFTAVYAATWQPLVWLSYMLDYRISGPNPFPFHLTNIVLHLANTLLLFLVLRRMTGSLWRSGFVAAVFAVHPLRVESVAWIAERKDVLSAFFWILTMWAYAWYVESPGVRRYLAVMACFALGLMAKPMLVTLPFALVLLDYWPLRRFDAHVGAKHLQADHPNAKTSPANALPLLDKVPLLALAAGAGMMAYHVQKVGGAVSSLERTTFGVRIADAFVFYVAYIWKMIWPVKLAVIYPHPGASVPVWQVVGSIVLLACITALSIYWWRRRPYVAVGWLWFLGTLIPVIGIVQIGPHGIADRFTYIPMIGLLLAITWALPELIPSARPTSQTNTTRPTSPIPPFPHSPALTFSAIIALLALMACTCIQVRYWKDNLTLFSRAVACTTRNVGMLNNVGLALAEEGRLDKAIGYYRKALSLSPDDASLHNNIGIALTDKGRLDEAVAHYVKALRIKPVYPQARSNLGFALYRQGKLDQAIRELKGAIRDGPEYAAAYQNLAHVYVGQGRPDRAIAQLERAVKIDPDFADAHYNLAILLGRQGRVDEAVEHLREVVRITPGDAVAHFKLGMVFSSRKQFDSAIGEYQEAVRLQPDMLKARNYLAVALYFAGRYAEAWDQVHEIRRVGADVPPQFLAALSSKMQEPR